ncbi:hypothetical protein SAMN05216188_11576 [Lentzea xinjiangensis]|uniref:Uncharacterized protein n=1 Tax=Lentzea xinjiangensis TaxID=402600 RepID=A0A1H9RVZ3_9PSEU|nr:hypothetical protein [Lentzea xinjiangensis]SER76595.1 hypothetical protein SAMN05216188_11576 [Lentzea xinjiangensis]
MSTEIKARLGVLRPLATVFLTVAVTHLTLAAHDRVLWPVVFAVLATMAGLYLEYRIHRDPPHRADQPGLWLHIPLPRTAAPAAQSAPWDGKSYRPTQQNRW